MLNGVKHPAGYAEILRCAQNDNNGSIEAQEHSGQARLTLENDGSLIIKGIRIDSSVLQREAIRRCGLGECQAACCTGGVWVDADHAQRILAWTDAIKPCLPPDRRDASTWFAEDEADDDFPSGRRLGTNIVDDPQRPGKTCCVFLRHDRKCALQVASSAHNLGWPGLKPYYCAIYPMTIEDNTLMMDDETPRDFEGGDCRRPAPDVRPLFQVYREEALLALGEEGYQELCEKAG